MVSALTELKPADIAWSELAHNSIWLNQLQYRKTIFNQWKSEADASFFISAHGKYDPVAELQATYELLLNQPDKPWGYTGQPVICALPTRKKFLEQNLNIRFKEISCPERDEWMKAFLSSQTYLVFSDAFPDNPASMFGHTFLLFSNHTPPDSAKGLLDYAINFSADTSSSEEKSLMYSIKGLFGAFAGRYRINKFYQMANQYANFDSRDMWYLKIPFTADQQQRFLDHIWEIFTTTYFDYYFFDQNCSYRILAAFDYANPDLKLLEEFRQKFPLYYVAPLSTYRTIAERYNISKLDYSPSIWKRVRKKVKELNSSQHENFINLKNDMSQIQKESDVKTLDALALYFDYKKRATSSLFLTGNILSNLRVALVRRSELSVPSLPEEKIIPQTTPLQSHHNKSAWLGFLHQSDSEKNERNAGVLGVRASYHDLLNPSAGYDTWSDLTALDTEINFYNSKPEVQFFKVFYIRSLFPSESYERRISWAADGGYDANYKNYIKGGAGYALQNEAENLLGYFYFMPLVSADMNVTSERGYTFLLEAGTVFDKPDFGRFWLYGLKNIGNSDEKANTAIDSIVAQMSFQLKHDHELRLKYIGKRYDSAANLIYQLQF